MALRRKEEMLMAHRIHRSYNISESILAAAERFGLDALSTGGGMDYVYRSLGKNDDGSERMAVLCAALDSGSPEKLNAKSQIFLVLNGDWRDVMYIGTFRTAKEAMAHMAKEIATYQ